MSQSKTTGKLAARSLSRLLARYAAGKDPAVIVGPGIGLDAAAVSVPAGVLVLASDPVTYASQELGRYAVQVNANDVFVCGAEPRWFLADVLLPPGRERDADRIFRQIHQACEELGVTLVGGHTELTPDLPRPLIAGFMIGQLMTDRVLTAGGVQPGDTIILTKGVAIEGTAILAKEGRNRLRQRLSASMLRRAKRLLSEPGISVGPEARIAVRCGVHAMHDPTEGGLLNGLWEMAHASGLTLHINLDRTPVYAETEAVCRHLNIDPWGLLASGALLIACPGHSAKKLLKALAAQHIAASEIGRAEKGKPGVYLDNGKIVRRSVPDEILKVLDDCE